MQISLIYLLGTIRQGLRNNEVTYVPPDDIPISPKNSDGNSPMNSTKGLINGKDALILHFLR